MAKSSKHARGDSPAGALIATALKGVVMTAGVAAIANLGRKIAVQAPTAMAQDWCEGLVREHEATLAVIDQLADTSADQTARRTIMLMNLKHILTKHAMQEELVIYPVLRRGDGAEATDELNQEHGEVKAMLYELGHMEKDDPEFPQTLGKLRSTLKDHMREEEDTLFPALRDRLNDEENLKLTRDMNMAGLLLA